ncbi:hypothetical protein [uncultured Chryseobacterium sp.]|uniref:hypothetical protein n=1 Tax=uncultured Chryseobacterium sp. TaxID=259322 RepID=UPI0025E273D6|nr:hypothetical protein [uncultured Chryseobacterium sp.]
MAINKPYKRIFRLMVNGNEEYILDPRYSPDRISFIHSYHLIEKDLKILFDFISPNCLNNYTFSHRIYELFFRCCTEFENNAKAILISNGYVKSGNFNIADDYFKINKALKLNNYKIRLNVWENNPLIITPYAEWSEETYTPLPWYRDYNQVKHNRSGNFNLANFKNLITAAAGLMALLYAQYGYHSFSPYQAISMFDDQDGFESANDSLFEVYPDQSSEDDKYDFDWAILKNSTQPMENFIF